MVSVVKGAVTSQFSAILQNSWMWTLMQCWLPWLNQKVKLSILWPHFSEQCLLPLFYRTLQYRLSLLNGTLQYWIPWLYCTVQYIKPWPYNIIHYIIINNGIMKSNSSIFPRSEGYITHYTVHSLGNMRSNCQWE